MANLQLGCCFAVVIVLMHVGDGVNPSKDSFVKEKNTAFFFVGGPINQVSGRTLADRAVKSPSSAF